MEENEEWFDELDEIQLMEIEAEQKEIERFEELRRFKELFLFYKSLTPLSRETVFYNVGNCKTVSRMKERFIEEEMYEDCQLIAEWENDIERIKKRTHHISKVAEKWKI